MVDVCITSAPHQQEIAARFRDWMRAAGLKVELAQSADTHQNATIVVALWDRDALEHAYVYRQSLDALHSLRLVALKVGFIPDKYKFPQGLEGVRALDFSRFDISQDDADWRELVRLLIRDTRRDEVYKHPALQNNEDPPQAAFKSNNSIYVSPAPDAPVQIVCKLVLDLLHRGFSIWIDDPTRLGLPKVNAAGVSGLKADSQLHRLEQHQDALKRAIHSIFLLNSKSKSNYFQTKLLGPAVRKGGCSIAKLEDVSGAEIRRAAEVQLDLNVYSSQQDDTDKVGRYVVDLDPDRYSAERICKKIEEIVDNIANSANGLKSKKRRQFMKVTGVTGVGAIAAFGGIGLAKLAVPERGRLAPILAEKKVVPTPKLRIADDADRLAFITTIDQYEYLDPLPKTWEDAGGYKRVLTEKLGFELWSKTPLRNPNRDKFFKGFHQYLRSIQPGDAVVFVYSGHGWSDETGTYLIPVNMHKDTKIDELRTSSIALQRDVVAEIMKRNPSMALIIVDACRDNPFSDGSKGAFDKGINTAPPPPQSRIMIAYAASEGQKALERLSQGDKEKFSVFTRALLPRLEDSERTLNDIFQETREQVEKWALKEGFEQTPAIYSELSRDFCFEGKNCRSGGGVQLD